MVSAVALLRTFSNAEAAQNYGLVFEFRRGMNFVSPKLHEFSLSSNFTFVESSIDLENVGETVVLTSLQRPMQGQSRYVTNAIGGWARPKARGTACYYFNYFLIQITDGDVSGSHTMVAGRVRRPSRAACPSGLRLRGGSPRISGSAMCSIRRSPSLESGMP